MTDLLQQELSEHNLNNKKMFNFKCPNCGSLFNLAAPIVNLQQSCPSCKTKLQIDCFPALLKPKQAKATDIYLDEKSNASCYYHPDKKAIVPCSSCGRFICSLCDIEFEGQHICPQCFQKGRTRKKLKNLEKTRFLYDCFAMDLSVISVLIFYFSIITSPIVIYIVFRHWNSPRSIIHTSRIRFVIGISVALIQLVIWISVILFFIF